MLLRFSSLALSVFFFGLWALDAWSFRRRPIELQARLENLKFNFGKPSYLTYPQYNPYTPQKEHLGKLLFFDPLLSRSQTMSCASCHQPQYDFTDPFRKALGKDKKPIRRRTQTLLNVAFGMSFFWDGRASTLEEQAIQPVESPEEMDLPLPVLIERLKKHPHYPQLFQSVFPQEGISKSSIAQALATFERSIVSKPAPFDLWVEGKEEAISETAKKGFVLFNDKAKCVTCHTGWNFSNGSFADTGLSPEDFGKGKVIGLKILNHGFKTPTLRNITSRAPYMHDGSIETLEAVIEHYDRGGTYIRESTQLFINPLGMSQTEKQELLEFLKTLTSQEGLL